MQESLFSYTSAYEVSVKEGYPICSEIRIDQLIESRCKEEGGEFWSAYMLAKEQGYFFIGFKDANASGINPFKVPRFSELDFEKVIADLGGVKIPESTIKTPDFLLNDAIYELKDIQSESLFNRDRQQSIGKVFENNASHFIDLNPQLDYGQETAKFHQLIKNTIQSHFKKASEQIKSYKSIQSCPSAGIILLNTGMFSLPHELLKKFSKAILQNSTTVEFALVFSQIIQASWFDLNAVYAVEFVGKEPPECDEVKAAIKGLVNKKMTLMVRGEKFDSIMDWMHPISFEVQNRIYFWNPGKIKSTLPQYKSNL